MTIVKRNRLYVYAFWGALFFERSIWINYLQYRGFTTLQIGFLQTILTLAMFIFELPSGILTDRLGPRKTMNFGHALIILYLLTMLFAFSYFSLVIGFLAYGLGLSLISGSDQTLIYQIHPEQSYQHKIGIFEAITIIGLTISSLLGGALTTISWDSIFILGILTQVFAIILLFLLKKQTHEDKVSDDELPMSLQDLAIELFKMLKKRHIRYLVMTISVFQSAISVLINFAQLLFSAKHFSAFQTAIVLTIALAFSAVASVSIEKVSAKIGNKRAVFLFLFITIAMFAILKSNTYAVIVLGFLLIQFSFEFVDTSLNAVVQDLANDKIRTSLISSVNTLTAGLMFFETMLTSALFSMFGVESSFILCGIVVSIVTMLLYTAFLSTQKRNNNN